MIAKNLCLKQYVLLKKSCRYIPLLYLLIGGQGLSNAAGAFPQQKFFLLSKKIGWEVNEALTSEKKQLLKVQTLNKVLNKQTQRPSEEASLLLINEIIIDVKGDINPKIIPWVLILATLIW